MALVLGQTYIKEPGRPLVGIHRVKVLAVTDDSFTVRPVANVSDIYIRSSTIQTITYATSTTTFTDEGNANDSVVYGGITYLLEAAPGATAFSVDVGTDATGSAANLTACIMIDISLGETGTTGDYGTATTKNPFMTASSAAGVVTCTAVVPGAWGNALRADDGTDADGKIATTAFSGGAGANTYVEVDSNSILNTAIIEGGVVDDILEIVTLHASGAGINYSATG